MRPYISFGMSLSLMAFLLCVLFLPDEAFVLFVYVFTEALFATLFVVALLSELFILAVIHIHYHGLIKSKNKQFGLILLNAHLLVGAIQLTAHLWPELTLWTNAAISFGLLIFLNLPLFLVLQHKHHQQVKEPLNQTDIPTKRQRAKLRRTHLT